MNNINNERKYGKTVERVLKMLSEGCDISQIARTLRIPVYKVAEIAQKEYINNKLKNGEEL